MRTFDERASVGLVRFESLSRRGLLGIIAQLAPVDCSGMTIGTISFGQLMAIQKIVGGRGAYVIAHNHFGKITCHTKIIRKIIVNFRTSEVRPERG